MQLSLAIQIQLWTVTHLPRLEPTEQSKQVKDYRNTLPVTFYTKILENEYPPYHADYLDYCQERNVPTTLPGSSIFGAYANLATLEFYLNANSPLSIEWEDKYTFILALDNGILVKLRMDFFTHHLQTLLLDTTLQLNGQKWGCVSFSQQFLTCHIPSSNKLIQYTHKPSGILEPDKNLAWFMSKSTASEFFFPYPGKFKSQASYPYIVFWSSSLVHVFRQVKAANNQLQLSILAELKYEEPIAFVHFTSLHTLYIGFQSNLKERTNEFWLRGYKLKSSLLEEMDTSILTFTLASTISCYFANPVISLKGTQPHAQGFTLFIGTYSGHLYHFFVHFDVTLSFELRVQDQFEPLPLHLSLHSQGWLLAIVYPQGKIRLCDPCFQVFYLTYNTLCVETLDALQWLSFQTPPILVSWSPSAGTSSHTCLVIAFDRGPLMVLHFPVIGQLPWTTYVHLLVSHHALDRLRQLLALSSVLCMDTLALMYGLLQLYTPYLTRTHVQKDLLTFISRCSRLPTMARGASISLLPIIRHLIVEWIHFHQDFPALHAASVYECTDLVDKLRRTRLSSSSSSSPSSPSPPLVDLCRQLLNLPTHPSLGMTALQKNILQQYYKNLGDFPTFGKKCKKYAVHLECHGELMRAKAQWNKLHNDFNGEQAVKRLLQIETYLRKAPKPFQ